VDRFRVLGNLPELKDAGSPDDDHDHGTSDHRNQRRDGGWSVTVESDKVHGRALRIFGNEDNQDDEQEHGSDDSSPAGADSGGGNMVRGRGQNASLIVD
jgi:hypothetical protein